jgi:hypothetical protein
MADACTPLYNPEYHTLPPVGFLHLASTPFVRPVQDPSGFTQVGVSTQSCAAEPLLPILYIPLLLPPASLPWLSHQVLRGVVNWVPEVRAVACMTLMSRIGFTLRKKAP